MGSHEVRNDTTTPRGNQKAIEIPPDLPLEKGGEKRSQAGPPEAGKSLLPQGCVDLAPLFCCHSPFDSAQGRELVERLLVIYAPLAHLSLIPILGTLAHFRHFRHSLYIDHTVGQLHGRHDVEHISGFTHLLLLQKVEVYEAGAADQDGHAFAFEFLQNG